MILRINLALARAALRLKRREDGTTAVEFAFVAAPFLYLLLAIFETGLMLFAEYIVEHGTAQAGRMIRTGQVQNGNISKAEFKTLVCGRMASFLNCNANLHVDVRKYTNFSSVSQSAPVGDDGELTADVTTGAQWQPGEPNEVVVVRTYYDWQLFTPGISRLANLAGGRRVLIGTAVFRNEPYKID